MVATQPAAQKPRTFFGHPKMLANLFTVEMWERFSFYGMQALALYYLYHSIEDGGLGIPKEAATGAMGAYGATVYLMAILGGILGDRVLGPERTLFYSAIGIMAGHIVLAVMPGAAGVITGLLLVRSVRAVSKAAHRFWSVRSTAKTTPNAKRGSRFSISASTSARF